MNTSPREERAVEKTVSVYKQQELETRLVLHELYSDQLQFLERKIERIREYLENLRSPEVDFATLMSNSLLDEDKMRWVEEDYDLIAMAYPEWLKRFKDK